MGQDPIVEKLYDTSKTLHKMYYEYIVDLSGKASNLFSFSFGIIALIITVLTSIRASIPVAVGIPLFAGICLLFTAAIFALRAYWLRRIDLGPDPAELQNLLTRVNEGVEIVSTIVATYCHRVINNDDAIEDVQSNVRRSFYFFVLGMTSLSIAGIAFLVAPMLPSIN